MSAPIVYLAVDGEHLPERLTKRVLSFDLDEEHGKALKLSLVLDDPDGSIREGYVVREGQTITARWGYVGGPLSRVVAAVVHSVEPGYDDDTVKISAMGRELALSRGAVRRVFRGRTFREALSEIAQEALIPLRWESAGGAGAVGQVRLGAQVIDNETAWAWVLRESSALGLEVEMDGDTLAVREPALRGAPALVLHHRWRDGEILRFETETNTKRRRHEDEGLVVAFVDPVTGQRIEHAAGDPNTTRATLAARRVALEAHAQATQRAGEAAAVAAHVQAHPELATAAPAEQRAAWERTRGAAQRRGAGAATEDAGDLLVSLGDGSTVGSTTGTAATATVPTVIPADVAAARAELAHRAEGRYRERDRARVKARCTIVGEPRLRRGMLVQIVGVSARDAGLWRVRACRQRIGDGYETEIELRRDGVNGSVGSRAGAGAQQNPNAAATPGSSRSGLREPEVAVDLAAG